MSTPPAKVSSNSHTKRVKRRAGEFCHDAENVHRHDEDSGLAQTQRPPEFS